MWGSNSDSWHVGTEFSRQFSSRIYLAICLFKKLNTQCLHSLAFLFVKRFASLFFTFLYFWIQNIEISEELFLFFSTLQNRHIIMFTIICFFNIYCIYIINYCFYYYFVNYNWKSSIAWIYKNEDKKLMKMEKMISWWRRRNSVRFSIVFCHT